MLEAKDYVNWVDSKSRITAFTAVEHDNGIKPLYVLVVADKEIGSQDSLYAATAHSASILDAQQADPDQIHCFGIQTVVPDNTAYKYFTMVCQHVTKEEFRKKFFNDQDVPDSNFDKLVKHTDCDFMLVKLKVNTFENNGKLKDTE